MSTTLHQAAAMLAAAGAAVTVIGASPAHAVTAACGDNQLDDGVYMRACWSAGEYGDGTYTPAVKFRIPFANDPNKWTACTAVIALGIKSPADSTYQIRYRTTADCTAAFKQFALTPAQAFYMWPSVRVLPQRGYCYKAITRWEGTYGGQQVGSASNAHGPIVCGADRPTTGGDGVVGVDGTPALGFAPAIDPN